METIASRKNPLVLLARRVADGDPQERGRMLLDGLHLVQEARAAGIPIQTAAFATRALGSADGEARRLATTLANVGVRVVQVSDAVMDALSPVSSPSGIVALATRPKHDLGELLGSAATTDLKVAGIPSAAMERTNAGSLGERRRQDLGELLGSAATADLNAARASPAAMERTNTGSLAVASHAGSEASSTARAAGSLAQAGSQAVGPLIVVVVDVQDPGNLGAIVRVAEAGGAAGVVVCGASADPYGWKALRGAMGSGFRLPIVREPDAQDLVARLKAAGVRVLATAQRQGPFYDRPLTGACAILLGGEGPGLSAELIAAADGVVSIPMQPPVESLNVAVSAAVIIYEARRQRAQVHEQQRITVRG